MAGVKFEVLGDPSTARLVLRYVKNGYENALDKAVCNAEMLAEAGYRRANDAAHIQRDIHTWLAKQDAMEEMWQMYDLTQRLRAEALAEEGAARKGKKGAKK